MLTVADKLESGHRARGSIMVGLLLGFVLASLVGVLAVRLGWISDGRGVDRSHPAVVHQIQQLQRLETVVFRVEKIVSGGQENRYLPHFLAGDRLLLVAYGEVTAGVDLGAIGLTAVDVEGGAVRITLPRPEVFATRVDNDRTRVYSRETGLFSRVDPNLETEVRRAAEQEITRAALDGGVLRTASRNARTTLTAFVMSLGFDQVHVE
jgi:hypothetical protein